MRTQIPSTPTVPTVQDNMRAAAYVRQSWSDPWQFARFLQPISATRSVAPSVSHARLRYRFGRTRTAGESDYSAKRPYDLVDWYVQIRQIPIQDSGGNTPYTYSTHQPVWTGLITEEGISPHGSDVGVPQGDQAITAWGLEHLLDQDALRTARAQIDGTTREIASVPEVNGTRRWGPDAPGNRSASTGSDDVYVYSQSGQLWTARQYIDYLLEYHQPADVTFALGGQTEILDHVYPRYRAEGRTPWQVLEHIIPRQRGIVWWVEIRGEQPTLMLDTVFGQDVSVGDVTIPANSQRTSLDWSDDPYVSQPTIRDTHTASYDRVVVRGEPIVSCFSLTMSDGNLERAWTDAEESAYESATREDRHEDVHDRTYRTYRVASTWDWASPSTADSYTGDGGTASPAADPAGGIDRDTSQAQFAAGDSLLRWLPIPEAADDSGARPERRKPFAWATYDPGDGDRVVRLDAGHPDGDLGGMPLRIRDSELALQIDAEPPHLLALNHLDPTALSGEQQVETDPAIDYDTVGVTVAARLDQRLKVEADLPTATGRANPRTLTIDVPGAEYWHVAPGTVAAVSDGAEEPIEDYAFDHGDLLWLSDGIRDDTEELREVAALAKTWYGFPRKSVSFGLDRLSPVAPLGAYVTAAFSSYWEIARVGTVVTEVQWDFEGESTSYQTGYHELDLQRLAQFPGLSSPRTVAQTVRQHDRDLRSLQNRTANLPTRLAKTTGGDLPPIEFIFGVAGSVIPAGAEAWVRVPYSGTITAWTILGDPTGSITIDVWKDTYAHWPPADDDSITNGHEPAVSSASQAEDTDLSDWSDRTVSAGDIVYAHVDSVTDIERAWLMLEVE